MNHEIAISNLTKYYHNHKVLDSITLNVKKGEFIMLLGRSGCGKTTLLNILGGFEPFHSGFVRVQERTAGNAKHKDLESSLDSQKKSRFFTRSSYPKPIYQIKPNKKCIKIFQEYALLPWKSAFENIRFVLKANKIPDGDKIAKKYLEIVGLHEHSDKFPSALSGGQKQRVAIARAMCLKPDILLLDEPFSALDYFIRENLQKLILRLSKSLNMTIVFVTHDIDEAILLGDRIIILHEGKIVREFDNQQKPIKDSRDFYHLKERIAFELQGFEEMVEYNI
ncbi:nitrate ABC transporter ATP-binding protein [Helicobacter aurati]|uniref:Nitrate ABC transporter ATP-binding protein n=2 Tax=Helicobacter aurati TaxID=137778 RepID=A0A3D8J5M5_9HELI|nr:nitrate ABC transporter ATP-binding protein [Helicobacter aurati]